MVKTRAVNFDEDLAYISRVFFNDDRKIMLALAQSKVQTRNQLLNLVHNPDSWRTVKWRNPQTQQEELLGDDKKLWVERVVSFINYMQNNHGGKVMHTVDLSHLTYDHFQNFCSLTAAEGGHPCIYDHDAALKSEVRNRLGIHATPSTTPVYTSGNTSSSGGNNSSNSKGNSTQLTAIQQQIALFVKSLPGDISFPVLDSRTNFMEWAITVEGLLELKDIPILNPGYSVPTDKTSDEYKLYTKQNTFLYMKLHENVKEGTAKRVVKAHSIDMDGRSVYLQIVKDNTGGSLTAELRAKYFHNLVHTMIAEKSPGEYVKELNRFHSTVAEYNAICSPGKELDGEPLLKQFERFITPLSELQIVESNADLIDRALDRRGLSSSSRSQSEQARDKMADYDDAALKLDEKFRGLTIGTLKGRKTFSANVSEIDLYDAPIDQLTTAAQESILEAFTESQEVSANVAEANLYYEVNTAEGNGRRYGYLPKDIYNTMSLQAQRLWMSLPANIREMIIVYKGVPKAAPKQNASPPGSVESGRQGPRAGVGRGILKGTGVATGARTANHANLVPVSEEGDLMLQGNTVTIADAIENETFAPTAFIDSMIRGSRSVNSAQCHPSDTVSYTQDFLDKRKDALSLHPGDIRRMLSKYAVDLTPTQCITTGKSVKLTPAQRTADDESVPELRETHCAQLKYVYEDDSLTVPSTVTDSYNTYDDSPDDLCFFDALD